jgi:hypothetical protein
MNAGNLIMRALSLAIIPIVCLVLFSAGCGKKDDASNGPKVDSTASSEAVYRDAAVPQQITDSTKVPLRCRVRRGEVYRFRETVSIDLQGEFAVRSPQGEHSVPSTGHQRSTFVFTIKVDSVRSDSSAIVTFRFDTINVSMESDQGKKGFNSADTAQMRDPQFALWIAIIDLPVSLTVSPRGEILSVSGLDVAVDKVALMQGEKDSIPSNVREMMRGQFGEGTIKPIAQHVFPQFRQEAVGVNDPWNLSFPGVVEGTFPSENTVNYRVLKFGVDGKNRTAEITSELAVRVKKIHDEDSSASVTLKNSSFGGQASTTIDLDRGIVLQRTASLWQSLEMLSVGRGKYAGGNGHITKNIKNTTVVARI